VKARLHSGLLIFGYFNAVGLMCFGYRYLAYVATRESVSPLEPFINEHSVARGWPPFSFPSSARFARRFRIANKLLTTQAKQQKPPSTSFA
jgi:hypothetical protein